jgi:probable phosphoglycerate mutase
VTESDSDSAAEPEAKEYRQYQWSLPPGATDLLVIRHGESAPARPDAEHPLKDGHSDPPLDPVGEAQAVRLADRLEHSGIAAIYVSTLRRTQQTAAPLAQRLGLTPTVEPDLREVFLGEWEGATFRKNTAERHPLAIQMFQEGRWDVIPGAESTEALHERVRRGVAKIAAAHANERVALFVHGGVIGTMLTMATGARGFAFIGADNASISQLIVSGDDWGVRRFNDTAHLDQSFTLVPNPVI